ncbi:uncharacterized protein BO97DRAFT_427413 [Aspergillus homomorphus CBS 101889]|uniref:Uncharacterized protein n=1 Tax=Aspergillus homomorphus (strain CBS 101889) TaxID=1450537 RepID=A0A395HNL9_ASPHC|nr:hypothetical protein BO97DRAFT_427413 [Aspergillus homomorphus CBS 101889]RAL09350.1 hypothetical protein BO97DRAFT_427413 [Aspergillus homomorphus CBS 101889]
MTNTKYDTVETTKQDHHSTSLEAITPITDGNRARQTCWLCGHDYQPWLYPIPEDSATSLPPDIYTLPLPHESNVAISLKTQTLVTLCKKCATETTKPHLQPQLFYPQDLDFFIAFELRERSATRSAQIDSEKPSKRDYEVHLVEEGRMPFWVVGALYCFVELGGPGSEGDDQTLWEGKSETKVQFWDGEPVAAILRAVRLVELGLGGARVDAGVVEKLLVLRDLYAGEEVEDIRRRYGAKGHT